MAKALTLLGLVANVFQFIELGCNILSTAKKAYEDSTGLSNDIRHVDLLLEDISNTRNWIEIHMASQTLLSMTKDEVAI